MFTENIFVGFKIPKSKYHKCGRIMEEKKKVGWIPSTPRDDKNMYSIADRVSKENMTFWEI